MEEAWKELKETIIEIKENNTFKNEEVTLICQFLENYMNRLEDEANIKKLKKVVDKLLYK